MELAGVAYTWGASWGTLQGDEVQLATLFSITRGGEARIRAGERTVRKSHSQLEETAGPDRLVLAGNTAFPDLEVKHALCSPGRFCEEAEWVVLAPLLSVTCGVSW